MDETPITPEEYFLLAELVKSLSQNKDLSDDLLQEISIYWIELDDEKKTDLRSKNLVKAWFIRTILNQDRSKTSPFYKKYKTQPMVDSRNIEDISDLKFEESERDFHLDLMKNWVEDLFLSDKNIIKDYFEHSLTIMGIAAKYDIDKNHVVSVINRIKNSFYRRIIWRKVPRKRLELFLADHLAPMIGRKRLKAEERQMIIDAHNFLYGSNYNTFFDRELCSLLLQSLTQKLFL